VTSSVMVRGLEVSLDVEFSDLCKLIPQVRYSVTPHHLTLLFHTSPEICHNQL